tara:strand:- start:180 stop:404 length:225 start_codon:yes stop_codon:yes gene_type:complete
MFFVLKKLLFSISFNFSLFLLLIIGIQNSLNKSKVNLLIEETVFLPVGFILGSSFITGSIFGSLITINFSKKNQ